MKLPAKPPGPSDSSSYLTSRLHSRVFAAAMLIGAGTAHGEVALLDDLNSSQRHHTQASDGAPIGLNRWSVDGVNHVQQQSFWYRLGSLNREFRIDGSFPVSHVVTATTDFNLNSGSDDLLVVYEDNETSLTPETFSFILHYQLSGDADGSGKSLLLTDFTVGNTGNDPLDISIFLFSDFDLTSSAADDLLSLNAAAASQTDANTSLTLTHLTGLPDRFEAGAPGTLLTRLDDGSLDDFGGLGGPLGPGNVASVYQWDFSIDSQATTSSSWATQITAVPEASNWIGAGVLLGLLGGVRWLRHGRRNQTV